MSERHWARRRWKLILNIVTLVALAVLIYFLRDQLGETINNLGKVTAWVLILIIPVEILNYHAQAKLFQSLFAMVGNKLSYKSLYKTALELNFVNHVFPSGGVTGMSYFSLRMRKGEELTAARATLVNVVKLGLTFVSFELLIVFALFSLAIMGRASNLVILVATALSTLLLVATVGFAWLVGSKSRINHFFVNVTKALNYVIHLVRPHYPETISIDKSRKVFDDFHNNYAEIKSRYQELKKPFWYALLANVTEVGALYVVFLAFGEPVNVGAVILAYAIANFAGFISVLPGGIGIYEALMVTTLAATGVPASVSLPVVVMYRVVNTIIQIPPGYYFYQQALRSGQTEPPPVKRELV